MSYNPFFSLKATNSNIASFSSTEEETYILLIANDIEKQTENGTIKNSANSNAILIGANTINNTTDEHELSITVRNTNNSEIIENVLAKFNNNNILFKTDTIFENNILPNNTNNQNIGNTNNKWGTIYANDIIVDGANITNINLNDKTTDDLNETANNRYYK